MHVKVHTLTDWQNIQWRHKGRWHPVRQLRVSPLYFFPENLATFLFAVQRCHPCLFFSWKLTTFLLITVTCYWFHSSQRVSPPWRVSPHTFFYLSDLVSPLFFVNFAIIFFLWVSPPWRVSPGAVRPPVTPLRIYHTNVIWVKHSTHDSYMSHINIVLIYSLRCLI